MFTWSGLLVIVATSITYVSSTRGKHDAPTYVPNRCFLDKAQGSCNDYTRSYYFNVNIGQCEAFVYSGCGGNWNRFNTMTSCHRTCTCALPPETGPCRGHARRWFYSPADGCCRPFIYGGCGGNRNSYASWTQCSEMCGYPTANSNWWKWGAEWGNWSDHTAGSQSSNSSYNRNDFMRDWMLWSLLSGGEFEMEDIARLIGQAHIFNLRRSMGKGGMQFQGMQSLGGGFGLGGQMSEQEGLSGMFGNMAGNMQSSGMTNMGPAYNTGRPGSFTPLGHIGSIANMMNGEGPEWAGASEGWGQFAGFQRMAQNINNGFQGSFGHHTGGQSQNTGGWMGMSGQGQLDSVRQGMSNQGTFGGGSVGGMTQAGGTWNATGSGISNIIDMGSGTLGYLGPAGKMTGQGGMGFIDHNVGNTAIEILHLISQIGRGTLGPMDLRNLGQRYGAVGPSGEVDVNLLATKMVSVLQGPQGAMNMARLRGVAQRLGALDSNGNINIPLVVKGMTEKLAARGFNVGLGANGVGFGGGATRLGSGLGGVGVPSLDEFNWLGSGKRMVSSGAGPGPAQGGGRLMGGRGSNGPGPSSQLLDSIRGIKKRLGLSGLGNSMGSGVNGISGSGAPGGRGSNAGGWGSGSSGSVGSVSISAGSRSKPMGSYGKK